ncbi:hypothetical protein B0G85_0349 [Polynucleobacter brandtiae]|uniref:Uncharacterized protein n=1 Tax=Polynucleobacter brandtiae TaxID=1938816 RepID=A0A2M8VYP1_9BURK|nr:hypothetical protein B0G85_0349 [Polynucleobacter brandtiae]
MSISPEKDKEFKLYIRDNPYILEIIQNGQNTIKTLETL